MGFKITSVLVLILMGFTWFFHGDSLEGIEKPPQEREVTLVGDSTDDLPVVHLALNKQELRKTTQKVSVLRIEPPVEHSQTSMDGPTAERIREIRQMVDEDQLEEAVERLKQLLSEDQKNPHLLTELGFIYSALLDNPKEAERYLKKAIQSGSTQSNAVLELVNILVKKGDDISAQSFFDSLDPNAPVSILMAGTYFAQTGKREKAIAYLETVADDSNYKFQAKSQLYNLYSDSNKKERAIQGQVEDIETEIRRYEKEGLVTTESRYVLAQVRQSWFRILLKQKRYQKAESLLYTLLDADDSHFSPQLKEAITIEWRNRR